MKLLATNPSTDQINVLLIIAGAAVIAAATHNLGLAIGIYLVAMALRPLTGKP